MLINCRNGKRELVGKVNFELLETRGGDVSNNRFHVSTGTPESQHKEVGKRDACHDRRTHELPLRITIGNGERKGEDDGFQLWHE